MALRRGPAPPLEQGGNGFVSEATPQLGRVRDVAVAIASRSLSTGVRTRTLSGSIVNRGTTFGVLTANGNVINVTGLGRFGQSRATYSHGQRVTFRGHKLPGDRLTFVVTSKPRGATPTMRFSAEDMPGGASFVHKRIIGGIKGFIGGGPLGAASGFLGGGQASQAPERGFVDQRFRSRCIPPFFPKPGGGCEIDLVPGSGGGGRGPIGRDQGEVVMGRYGAGMVPVLEERDTRTCLPGMVLGNDGICYNRRDIKNAEREWPKGRRPLLTGGDRNAITKAARAARAIQRTTKSLQKMGMLPKPSSRPRKPPAAKRLAPGITVIDTE